MLVFFIAGIYFWMKELIQKDNGLFTKNKILAFFFLSLGAVIKQVPILVIPFAIISFSQNIFSFLINIGVSAVFYFFLRQPWSADKELLQYFSLFSKEGTAIFNFQLNGVSIFLFLYIVFFTTFFFKRKILLTDFRKPLYLICLILSLVYISEDSSFLFPQFNIWIMPFLALLILINEKFSLLMFIPIIGFFKRVMIGVDLSGLLNPTFGYGFNNILDYKYFIYSFVNPNLIGLFLTTLMFCGYFFLILFLIRDIFGMNLFEDINLQLEELRLSLDKLTKIILIGFIALFIADFIVKTRLTLLPTLTYQPEDKKILLSKKPIVVEVINNPNRSINGIDILSEKNLVNYDDVTIFKFVDERGKQIHIQRISDYLFPSPEENLTITLDKSIKSKKFNILIYKERGLNRISIRSAKVIGEIVGGSIYNNPDEGEILQLRFPGDIIFVHLRGQYEFQQMIRGTLYHINQKPKFFIGYFALISLLIVGLFVLSSQKFKKVDR